MGVSGETCSADSKAAGVWGPPGPKRLTHCRPSQVGGSCKDWKYGLTGKLKILGLLYHPFFCAHPIKMLRQNKPGSGLNGHGVKLKKIKIDFTYKIPPFCAASQLCISLIFFLRHIKHKYHVRFGLPYPKWTYPKYPQQTIQLYIHHSHSSDEYEYQITFRVPHQSKKIDWFDINGARFTKVLVQIDADPKWTPKIQIASIW